MLRSPGSLLSTHRRLSLALSRMVPLRFLLSPRGQSRLNAWKLPLPLIRFLA